MAEEIIWEIHLLREAKKNDDINRLMHQAGAIQVAIMRRYLRIGLGRIKGGSTGSRGTPESDDYMKRETEYQEWRKYADEITPKLFIREFRSLAKKVSDEFKINERTVRAHIPNPFR